MIKQSKCWKSLINCAKFRWYQNVECNHNDSDSQRICLINVILTSLPSPPPPPPALSLSSSLSSSSSHRLSRPSCPILLPPPPLSLALFSLSSSYSSLSLSSLLLSLSLSLSLCVVGSERDLGGVFQVAGGQNLVTTKSFPKPKTQDSTVNIHIAGMFFMKCILQAFRYCSIIWCPRFRLSPPVGFIMLILIT